MQKCGKKFGIKNNPLIGEHKQFLQEIIDKIPRIIKIGYQSLCKISKYFKVFLGIRISHQTIKKKQSTMKNLNILTITYMMNNF